MQTQIDVYWHDRRIGHYCPDKPYSVGLRNGNNDVATVSSISMHAYLTMRDIEHMPLVFDPDFAELYGITGVPLEPRKDISDA